MRLTSVGVKQLLARGKRETAGLAGTTFSSRTLVRADMAAASQVAPPIAEAPAGVSRIALSIPKRLLKRSVDRNRAKRVLRESFRLHAIREAGIDTLITLSNTPKPAAANRRASMLALRRSADAMFGKIAATVANKGHR